MYAISFIIIIILFNFVPSIFRTNKDRKKLRSFCNLFLIKIIAIETITIFWNIIRSLANFVVHKLKYQLTADVSNDWGFKLKKNFSIRKKFISKVLILPSAVFLNSRRILRTNNTIFTDCFSCYLYNISQFAYVYIQRCRTEVLLTVLYTNKHIKILRYFCLLNVSDLFCWNLYIDRIVIFAFVRLILLKISRIST